MTRGEREAETRAHTEKINDELRLRAVFRPICPQT